jgi:hypothetical protein
VKNDRCQILSFSVRDLRMDAETFAVAAGADQHAADVVHVDRHFDALAEVLAFRPLRAPE